MIRIISNVDHRAYTVIIAWEMYENINIFHQINNGLKLIFSERFDFHIKTRITIAIRVFVDLFETDDLLNISTMRNINNISIVN